LAKRRLQNKLSSPLRRAALDHALASIEACADAVGCVELRAYAEFVEEAVLELDDVRSRRMAVAERARRPSGDRFPCSLELQRLVDRPVPRPRFSSPVGSFSFAVRSRPSFDCGS